MKTALIYWPKGSSVEKITTLLESKLVKHNVEAMSLNDVDLNRIKEADLIIMGGSTVGADHWSNPGYRDMWEHFFAKAKENNILFKGKKVALYGLGNQLLYPAHYLDSMRDIADHLAPYEVELVGSWKNENYTFEESKALDGDSFIGLALDEDTQAELTDSRLDCWIESLGL